jgi:peptide/nickel transport system substrate-binding protein
VICLAHEPESLYRYALPEPDGNAGRAHILAALDGAASGPIDEVDGAYRPVLLEKLPSLADGDVRVDLVPVRDEDRVVDALGRVVTWTVGVTANGLDGALLSYAGSEARLPQVTVRFRLRPGLRWSDGEPLTARDSVFAFEVAGSPDSFNPDRGRVERTATYRALDETTVEWVGLPGAFGPDTIAHFWPPLPAHQLGTLTAAEIAADEAANRNPLSFGPFKLAGWIPGDRLVLERNPFYFRAAEGLPKLERVVYRFVDRPRDSGHLAEILNAAGCDLFPSGQGLESFPNRRALDSLTGLRVQEIAGPTVAYLHFDLAPVEGSGFFTDLRARQAAAACVERYSPDAATPEPGRGRALLAGLGWTDSDGDGLVDDGQAPLTLTLLAGAAGLSPEEGDLLTESLIVDLQRQLRENCGVQIEIRRLTAGELLADWPDGLVFGRRFDLALLEWRAEDGPACAPFLTEQIASDLNPGGANASGYSNPEYDRACRRALTALDPAQAARWRAEAEAFLVRDLPAIPVFARPRVAAVRPAVQGLQLDATAPSELWSLEEIWVSP